MCFNSFILNKKKQNHTGDINTGNEPKQENGPNESKLELLLPVDNCHASDNCHVSGNDTTMSKR